MNSMRMPVQLDASVAERLTFKTVESVKHISCSFYNECLDQAIEGNWANFGCGSCSAYKMIDADQREMDVQNLLVMDAASEYVSSGGNANRRRGVKPGSSTKRVVRLPVIEDRGEVSK